ncbi:MAG: hypothetical protein C5B52_04690 [Bacteroidetes bacterium]|nr:MAG: hypothetical protein C5B52_04690 [Bacteroidota bacterium]
MKKVYSGIVAMLTIAIFLAGTVRAQGDNMRSDLALNKESISQVSTLSSPYDQPVNPKAIKNFNKFYSDAVGAQWTTIKNQGFVCRFLKGDMVNRAYYNRAGNWVVTVSDIAEKQMPDEVRQSVRSSYFDYSIVFVQEISFPQGNEPVYKIQIQSDKEFKVLKLNDGEIEEVSKGNL